MLELSDYLSVSLSEYDPMILGPYKEGIWTSIMCRVLRVQMSVLLEKAGAAQSQLFTPSQQRMQRGMMNR